MVIHVDIATHGLAQLSILGHNKKGKRILLRTKAENLKHDNLKKNNLNIISRFELYLKTKQI